MMNVGAVVGRLRIADWVDNRRGREVIGGLRFGRSVDSEFAGSGFGVSAWIQFSLLIEAGALHWGFGWR
jgi:hypothetical protein